MVRVTALPPPRATDDVTDPASGPEPSGREPSGPGTAAGPPARVPAAVPHRRGLAAALLLGVVGAAVVLTAAGRTWAHGTAVFAQGSLPVHVTGRQINELPGALALVGLAALVAVFAVRGAGRIAVSALLALSGAGAMAAALTATGGGTALDAAAKAATGLTGATAHDPTATSWPLIAATGAALILAAGVLALLHGRSWPGMSNRYDRDGTVRPPRRARAEPVTDPDRPEDLWKALDRGEDPTDG